MPVGLEEVVKMALDLPPDEQRVLAGLLLDTAHDPDVEALWEAEIQERMRAIREGRDVGIPHEDVMREMEERLRS